jgi:hypothetical protein
VNLIGFEVVAVGMRWGGTQYNYRGNDLDPAPFRAVLSLAGASRAVRVAPEHFRGYAGPDCLHNGSRPMNLRSAKQFSPNLLVDVTDWDLAGYASGIVCRCDLNLVETSIVTC